MNLLSLFGFKEKRALGLDITDHTFIYTQLSGEGKSAKLISYGKKDIPDGVVLDGRVQDDGVILSLLREIQKETKQTSVFVSLPDSLGSFFKIIIPKVPYADIRDHIEIKLKEMVLFAYDEMILGFKVTKDNDKDNKLEVEAIVVPEEVGYVYKKLLMQSGFVDIHFRTNAQASAKAVILDDENPHMVVVLEDNNATVSMVQKGDIKQAHKFKYENHDLYDKVHAHHHSWNKEASDSDSKEEGLKCITLCGNKADMERLEGLAKKLKTKVNHPDMWNGIFDFSKDIPEISPEDSLIYVIALGLAREHLDDSI
ncbi:MAG: Tfp pilus assembly PilM family ATPase [Candidatus Paceibacteria bacterium]|jgi:Tfp pilus assembly PilM family ATPase